MRLIGLGLFLAFSLNGAVGAQDKAFSLSAPGELVESGFLKYLLPRFSLKTGIRIEVVPQGQDAEAGFGDYGTPVFEGLDTIWHYSSNETPFPVRFGEWLSSDVGRDTIASFAPEGTPPFSPYLEAQKPKETASLTGNAVLGEKRALSLCGRCHVVSEKNKMNAIGSTPSFALMRTFPDWQNRFEAFYVLRPHPAFTQIENVTEAFAPDQPSPIVPIELTLDDLDGILAYVATIAPADLGAPIKSQ